MLRLRLCTCVFRLRNYKVNLKMIRSSSLDRLSEVYFYSEKGLFFFS